jgi:glycerol-1-phosphate dehydrogenase [NAD(P)+]
VTLKLHQMQLPRKVVVGNGTTGFVVTICRKLGLSKSAFVVTGPQTYKVAGSRVINLLEDAGVDTNYMLVRSSTAEDLKAVEAKIEKAKPQVVLGVGGGTKIDVAKLSAAHQSIPFISVPTTASHDGIASPLASIKGSEKPYSALAQAPMAIIADTSVIVQASHRLTASGCGDVIAKFTAVRDWQLANKVRGEYYGEYAASLALMSAKLVAKNADTIKPANEEGLRVLLEALISCGVAMSIAGSSRPSSGSEHLFSHALDLVAQNPAMHGEQAGVGTIMMAHLHELNWRRVRSKLLKGGAPTTAEDLGVKASEIVEALVKARTIRTERYTILDQKRLTRKSARALAKKTEVI